MKLVRPNIKYKQSFLQAIDDGFIKTASHEYIQSIKSDFDAYIQKQLIDTMEDRTVLCEDGKRYQKIPQTNFWLIDNEEFIGMFGLRHYLNEFTALKSGHINYEITPSKRKQGYCAKGLELLLKEAKNLGIKEALVAAREDNIGSWKAIEKNGGILQNIIPMPWDKTGFKFKRYICKT